MPAPLSLFVALRHCFVTAILVLLDLLRLVTISFRARRTLAAENLFLRKQLTLFHERKVKPRRSGDATRWIMATMAPERVSVVLALEIYSNGKTAIA